MKFNSISFILLILLGGFAFNSCTDLEEEIKDGIVPESGQVDVASLLDGAYRRLETFQTQDRIWALQEHTSDEVLGPTRGTDWDDNGIWRSLHDHTWTDEHDYIRTSFNELNRGLYLSNNILAFSPTQAQEAEARFLRAFYAFHINDNWGQVPMRQPGEDIAKTLPTVMSSSEATDFIISELETILPNLPDDAPAHKASKNAARAILAKTYLNKGVWKTEGRLNPSFDAADMNKVIEYCDAITATGKYSIDDDFYDNFRPDNANLSSELIFTSQNVRGTQAGNVRSRWFCTLHYNQNPSGWNGFTTIADFYDSFDDPNDVRLSSTPSDLTPVSGLRAGFLVGQQFDKDGNALQDRKGNPLSFTKEVTAFETGDNLEVTGIRVIKYIPDFDGGELPDNDYVLLRYADIVLMKAEAIARGGPGSKGGTPASLVNSIRSKRNVAANSDGSLDSILKERGHELYWEGHRRQDLIRFGKYLDAWTAKGQSQAHRVLFPIPAIELAANPELDQNPGY